MAFSALFGNLYMIVSTICQSLNKYSAVYKISAAGFVLNALLDVPIMLLYHKIGLPVYLGSITASIIGFSTSTLVGLALIRKAGRLSYRQTLKTSLKILVPALIMLASLYLVKLVIPSFETTSRLWSVVNIAIYAFVGAVVYIFTSYKTGLLEEVFGKDLLNKILSKITFGKIQVK